LGKESTLIKTPAKTIKMIIKGGVTTYPTSMSVTKAAMHVDRKIAAMHSISRTNINIKKHMGSGFS
jgi:hypothetical protein